MSVRVNAVQRRRSIESIENLPQSSVAQDIGRSGYVCLFSSVLLAIFFVYPLTIGFALLDPDEGLHASIAQEMVEQQEWVVPHFLGRPFLDKPILYFWAEVVSIRAFGMHEAAVRLPGLMFGLLSVLTTGWLGWRLFDRQTGFLAGLCYATMILPVSLAQAAAHDVALIPWVCLALLFFWRSDRATSFQATAGYTVLAGVVLGLAVLTKGLVGVAIVGVAYGTYLLTTRRLTVRACGGGIVALVITVLVAAPWYLAMEARNPGYLHYWFVERHLMGYMTADQLHGQASWWYYLPILLGGGVPWLFYVPVVAQDAWARRRRARVTSSRKGPAAENASQGALTLLWCWFVGGMLFLSIAHSKAVTYIWPILPAVALLSAVAWSRHLQDRLSLGARRTLTWIFVLTCGLGVFPLPVAMGIVQKLFAVQFSYVVWSVAILLSLTLWIPVGLRVSRRPRLCLCAAVSSMAGQFILIMAVLVPCLAENISARELARYFNQHGGVPQRLIFAEDRIGSFVFYLTPELRADLGPDQLQEMSLQHLPEDLVETVIVVPLRHADRADACQRLVEWSIDRVGHYRVYSKPADHYK